MYDNNGSTLRVAFYLRVSTEDQVERYGLDLQKAAITALIQSKGHFDDGRPRMVLAGEEYIYVDEGISGTTDVGSRPGFARLIEDIVNSPEESKPFDIVAVYKIDRLARKLKVLIEVISFFGHHNLQMLSANESIDTSTPFGRAILGIIGVIAELEVETTKIRTWDGRIQAIHKGVFMGESPPFGYKKNKDKSLEILVPEMRIVQEIFESFVYERKSVQQIASDLTEREILSPSASAVKFEKRRGEVKKKNSNSFWRDKKVRDILSNEIYIGKYYYHKTKKNKRLPKEEWKLSDYVFPQIIDIQLFNLSQQRLEQSRTQSLNLQRADKNKHLYLLSGVLKCEACLLEGRDDEMTTWQGEPKKVKLSDGSVKISYSYKCRRRNKKKYSHTCNVIPLPAEQIEDIVVDHVRELILNPEPVVKYQNRQKSRTLELERLKTRREEFANLINNSPNREDRLKEQHEAGLIDLVELQQKVEELQAKKKEWRAEVEKVELRLGKITLSEHYLLTLNHFRKSYASALEDISSNRKFTQDVILSLVEKVVVKSRQVTPDDVVAGRKKADQRIPYKLDIHFRLPAEMLKEAFLKFGVKDADL